MPLLALIQYYYYYVSLGTSLFLGFSFSFQLFIFSRRNFAFRYFHFTFILFFFARGCFFSFLHWLNDWISPLLAFHFNSFIFLTLLDYGLAFQQIFITLMLDSSDLLACVEISSIDCLIISRAFRSLVFSIFFWFCISIIFSFCDVYRWKIFGLKLIYISLISSK